MEAQNKNKETLLNWACHDGLLEVARLLVEYGAQAKNGRTLPSIWSHVDSHKEQLEFSWVTLKKTTNSCHVSMTGKYSMPDP
jgi:hypothetical protein